MEGGISSLAASVSIQLYPVSLNLRRRCWRATNEKGLTPHLTTGTQTRYDLFSLCHTYASYIKSHAVVGMLVQSYI